MSKLLLAALASLSVAAPAHAQVIDASAEGARTMTINLSAYRLDQPSGVEKAHGAIQRSVRAFCQTGEDRSLARWTAEVACRRDALAQVAAQVRAPQLLALLDRNDRRFGEAGTVVASLNRY